MYSNGFGAEQHARPGFLGDFADPVVELEAGYRAAGGRE